MFTKHSQYSKEEFLGCHFQNICLFTLTLLRETLDLSSLVSSGTAVSAES